MLQSLQDDHLPSSWCCFSSLSLRTLLAELSAWRHLGQEPYTRRPHDMLTAHWADPPQHSSPPHTCNNHRASINKMDTVPYSATTQTYNFPSVWLTHGFTPFLEAADKSSRIRS